MCDRRLTRISLARAKPAGHPAACVGYMFELAPTAGLQCLPMPYAGARSTPARTWSTSSGRIAIPDFDSFFEHNYWPIVRSLTAAFGDAAAAEEAVQDAFVRANVRWRRVSRLDAPSAWVRRVAINRLKDNRRSVSRRLAAETKSASYQPATGTVEQPLVLDRADELLAALAARQRLAMALYYVEDVSVKEIAFSMKISTGAVKAHLSQGRANLEAVAGASYSSEDRS